MKNLQSHWKILVTATCLLCLLMTGYCRADDSNSDPIKQLMRLSGLKVQIEQVEALLLTGFDQARKADPANDSSVMDEVRNALSQGFSSEAMLATVEKTLRSGLESEDHRTLLKWYSSKEGRLISKIEEQSSTPEAARKMFTDSAALLKGNQHLLSRSAQVDRLVKGTELGMEIQKKMHLTMFMVFSMASNPDQEVNISAFNTQMYSIEPQLRAQTQQMTTLGFINTFKDVDVKLLDQYIDFLKSPAAGRFMTAAINGYKLAFDQSLASVREILVPRLNAMKTPQKPATK